MRAESWASAIPECVAGLASWQAAWFALWQFKLLSLLLGQTCQEWRETTAIIGRLAFETLVNIRFLIANFSPELGRVLHPPLAAE
ncbi:hypothetical protein [Azospirillum argentinense]